jgi:hypothetical protein
MRALHAAKLVTALVALLLALYVLSCGPMFAVCLRSFNSRRPASETPVCQRDSELTSLTLISTPVTEAGVKELKQLKRLLLLDTEVPENRLAELQKALPGCKINR